MVAGVHIGMIKRTKFNEKNVLMFWHKMARLKWQLAIHSHGSMLILCETTKTHCIWTDIRVIDVTEECDFPVKSDCLH